MWDAIKAMFGAWFRTATPQRADFESVTTMWQTLNAEHRAELAETKKELNATEDRLCAAYARIAELEDNVRELQYEIKECRKSHDKTEAKLLEFESRLKGNGQ